MNTFRARDTWGDQLQVHHRGAGAVQVRYLGSRGGLKGVMDLTAEQTIALAELLAAQLSSEFLGCALPPKERKKVNQ